MHVLSGWLPAPNPRYRTAEIYSSERGFIAEHRNGLFYVRCHGPMMLWRGPFPSFRSAVHQFDLVPGPCDGGQLPKEVDSSRPLGRGRF